MLVEKGLVDPAALDALVDTFEHAVGPRNGARVVARAWVDADYKRRLLADGTAAIAELGFSGQQGEKLTCRREHGVHPQRDRVHAVLGDPWPLLGLPPGWYKSSAYRSRTVADPRGVLRELGLAIPDAVEVRVWDSNSASRYFVLPERPAGTERLGEDELAALVTRDSMIGVAHVPAPRRADGP